MSEFYIVTALPHSLDRDATHHVSLYVSPRIVSGTVTELGQWHLFPAWAEVVRASTIELYSDVGRIPCHPILDVIAPNVWAAAFPSTTPVRDSQVPDWDEHNRRWRSFSAGTVMNIAKALHMSAIYAGPTTPPPPSRHPLSRQLIGVVGDRERYDESRVTAWFDRYVESDRTLADIEEFVDNEQDWLSSIGLQLHRCRRFYERPESQDPYQERPDPDAEEPKVARPEPEFHDRCATVGDMPALQRVLGLVIDLRVADLDALRAASWLSARIVLDGDASANRATRVRCRHAGEDLVSVPKGHDWADGALRLGDEELFTVLDLDVDGSALKMDRFIWTLPRLLKCEANDEPVNAATPALRAGGFTVARRRQALSIQQQLADQRRLASAMTDGREPVLYTEDITRGVRVEVWDHDVQRWRSLHHRLADIFVADQLVFDAHPEEGFIQVSSVHETPGVDRSPIHVHEALFGWEGWSLSVPRPGKRIVRRNGEEVVEDTPTEFDGEPTHPIRSIAQIRRGSLPRLRYGRAYAFRAWGVDLAGNSRPHDPTSAAPLTTDRVAGGQYWPGLRAATRSAIGAAPARRSPAAETPEFAAELARGLGADLAAPGSARRWSSPRARAVAAAFERALADHGQPFVSDPSMGRPNGTVTRLHPFLRWDPVLSPAVIPRHQYTAGESLRVLVIRSDVVQDSSSGTVVVTAPTATSQRHLAPPKTSQMGAELHGKFDEAIGSADPDDHRRMLGWILCEDGTFDDPTRADIHNPPARLDQPGIGLAHNGDQATFLSFADFAAAKKNQFDTGQKDGAVLPAGQYVVHNVDELALPYLPDPLAKGVSLVFPEAGADRSIPFPFGGEGLTADYGGQWPGLEPYRLVLQGGTELSGEIDDRTITIGVPPGDIQRFRLASSLDAESLDLFGPWRHLPESVRQNADVVAAAADGWLWALTPSEEFMLVHAVPRPIHAPRPKKLTALRPPGATTAILRGGVEVHGPSTDSLVAHAIWTDDVDDLTRDAPTKHTTNAVAFSTHVRPYESIALLEAMDSEFDLPSRGPVVAHASRHEIGDTRHHTIDYHFRATTRFREYFDPSEASDGSVSGPVVQVTVPSSARPAAPIVHSVLPMFRWSDEVEPEQPFAWRRTRRAGVRIYLERPWFSSGNNELLGVVLAVRGDEFGEPPEDESGFPFVSKWGSDPIWSGPEVGQRTMTMVQVDDLLRQIGYDDHPAPGRPVGPLVTLPLVTAPGAPQVLVAGYRPHYSEERQLWYADVALNPGATFWPFLRLAVCRYQPNSNPGCHLSPPVRCDFVQLPPERATSINRTDDSHVRVVVTGVTGRRVDIAEDRRVIARLQRRNPTLNTDLGWDTVDESLLIARGVGDEPYEISWVGELDAGTVIPLARPGDESSDWRIRIEEYEQFDADPFVGNHAPVPAWERRLVYADHLFV
ncbi:hypothetical protein ABQF34_19065 [Mycolicibacterium boenickei]